MSRGEAGMLAVADKDVAEAQPATACRAIRHDLADADRSGGRRRGDRNATRERDGLRDNAEMGAPHPAMADELAEHKQGGVAGYGETEVLCTADHRGVDPHELACFRDPRPPRVAWVERR